MDVSPFLIRLSGGLGEVEHRPCRESNETAFETTLALRRKFLQCIAKRSAITFALFPYRAPLVRVANRLYFLYMPNIVARAGEGFA
jgi:hypothetical protein